MWSPKIQKLRNVVLRRDAKALLNAIEKVAEEAHTPTDEMVAEAKRGLAWRREFNRGGTEVGVARARDISNKKSLPVATLKRMHSYFARHEVDKDGEGFYEGDKGFPSAGRIAWALWGGDAGKVWVNKLLGHHDKDSAVNIVDGDDNLHPPSTRDEATDAASGGSPGSGGESKDKVNVYEPAQVFRNAKLDKVSRSLVAAFDKLSASGSKYSSYLRELVSRDQNLRNKFAQTMAENGGWSAELVSKFVSEHGTRPDDVFGSEAVENELLRLEPNLDFDNFSDQDWNNYWLLSQHMDKHPEFQRRALDVFKNYRGNSSEYKNLLFRVGLNSGMVGIPQGQTVNLDRINDYNLDFDDLSSKLHNDGAITQDPHAQQNDVGASVPVDKVSRSLVAAFDKIAAANSIIKLVGLQPELAEKISAHAAEMGNKSADVALARYFKAWSRDNGNATWDTFISGVDGSLMDAIINDVNIAKQVAAVSGKKTLADIDSMISAAVKQHSDMNSDDKDAVISAFSNKYSLSQEAVRLLYDDSAGKPANEAVVKMFKAWADNWKDSGSINISTLNLRDNLAKSLVEDFYKDMALQTKKYSVGKWNNTVSAYTGGKSVIDYIKSSNASIEKILRTNYKERDHEDSDSAPPSSVIEDMFKDAAHVAAREYTNSRFEDEARRPLVKFDDGMYWVALERVDGQHYHPHEAYAMGHCGEAVASDGTVYSLRTERNKPVLTVEIADGKVVQAKSEGNYPMYANYVPQLKELMSRVGATEFADEQVLNGPGGPIQSIDLRNALAENGIKVDEALQGDIDYAVEIERRRDFVQQYLRSLGIYDMVYEAEVLGAVNRDQISTDTLSSMDYDDLIKMFGPTADAPTALPPPPLEIYIQQDDQAVANDVEPNTAVDMGKLDDKVASAIVLAYKRLSSRGLSIGELSSTDTPSGVKNEEQLKSLHNTGDTDSSAKIGTEKDSKVNEPFTNNLGQDSKRFDDKMNIVKGADEEKVAVGIPDQGVDENRYGNDYGRADVAIPRPSKTERMKYRK